MGWHKVSGTITFEQERGGMTTLVKVKEMKPITRPGRGIFGNAI
jgi:hypothetical protein